VRRRASADAITGFIELGAGRLEAVAFAELQDGMLVPVAKSNSLSPARSGGSGSRGSAPVPRPVRASSPCAPSWSRGEVQRRRATVGRLRD